MRVPFETLLKTHLAIEDYRARASLTPHTMEYSCESGCAECAGNDMPAESYPPSSLHNEAHRDQQDARTASLNKGEIVISGLVKTVLRVSIHRFEIFWERTMCALLRQQGIAKLLLVVCSVRLIMKEEPFKVTEGGKLVGLLLSKSSKRDYHT
jgi:hypothetical protein